MLLSLWITNVQTQNTVHFIVCFLFCSVLLTLLRYHHHRFVRLEWPAMIRLLIHSFVAHLKSILRALHELYELTRIFCSSSALTHPRNVSSCMSFSFFPYRFASSFEIKNMGHKKVICFFCVYSSVFSSFSILFWKKKTAIFSYLCRSFFFFLARSTFFYYRYVLYCE